MSGSNQTQQNQQQQQTTTTNPWSAQSPYLQQGFADAAKAMQQSNQAPLPKELTAGMTPQQLQIFQSMIGYGSNNTNPQIEQELGAAGASGGMSGALGALYGLQNYNPSSTNNINADVAGGNAYSAGANIPAQVQAAMRGANQEAHDVTLPGMESGAASSGNINNSRTGLAEGVVQRGLAQQAGDLTANLGANYYNTGAGLTSNENTANNNTMLSALTGAGGLGNTLFGSGVGALGQSINDQGNLFNIAGTGAAGAQANNQLSDTNAQQMYQMLSQAPFQGLNQFWNIVGGNNWGGTSNSTGNSQTNQSQTPSFYSTLGSLLGAGGSAFGGSGGSSGGLLNLMKLFSDRRIKKDIEQVGELYDGTPVYRFRYNVAGYDGPTHIGLMAQDVEQDRPEAVSELGGIKMVDYHAATNRAAAMAD